MNYAAEFSPEAIDDLTVAELSVGLLEQFDQQVTRLESNPAGVSRASWFPYPQCQIFEFTVQEELMRTRFRVLFKYGVDERSLYILPVDIRQTAE